ncbi:MAG TPA: hypothetical protein VMU22_15900 [Rhizomicrobium sp.]|nr:hypothetical protein [Rhizomicrobium sp.]
MMLLSYLVGLATGAHGWWGVALVVLIALGVPVGVAFGRSRKTGPPADFP